MLIGALPIKQLRFPEGWLLSRPLSEGADVFCGLVYAGLASSDNPAAGFPADCQGSWGLAFPLPTCSTAKEVCQSGMCQ